MCFVHKYMQNADFGQILSWRASTKSRVTSRPMVRFLQTWYQKMRKTWKKKVMKRRVAIRGGRGFRAGGGGGQIDPPPPQLTLGLTGDKPIMNKLWSYDFLIYMYIKIIIQRGKNIQSFNINSLH